MLTPDDLDRVTIDLLFALRDSLTSVSALDFWTGRAISALETAAAGGETPAQAVTIACRKLQIPVLTTTASKPTTDFAKAIGDDFPQWAEHVSKSIVYIIALANVERATRNKKKPKEAAPVPKAAPPATTGPVEPNLFDGIPF